MRRGAISSGGSMILISDLGRRAATKAGPADTPSMVAKDTYDDADGGGGGDGSDGKGGGDGATEYATKAHAVPAGRGLPDPRQRLLDAARMVDRSPYGKDTPRSVPERKSGTGAKSGGELSHEYMTD